MPNPPQKTAPRSGTRRWARYPLDLPVRILPCSRLPALPAIGRATVLSQSGMALYTGVDMELDDLIEVEFLTPELPLKVMASVRSRSGYQFGLAFLALRTDQSV